jgi:acetylornithine deacetylase/succinyl-diaminopimelate desuccinylase-like protein
MSRSLRKSLLLTIALAVWFDPGSRPVSAEPLPVAQIRTLTEANFDAAVALYREFLSLPNDANFPDDIARLVDWMEPAFAARGFEMRRIPTAGSPLLLAQRINPAAEKTVLVYLQSDGQPVDPSAWHQDDPYGPELKARDDDGEWANISWDSLTAEYDPNWRVFARSASDSKGPMTQFLAAMDILNQVGHELDFSLKVIIDTEEEMGSPNLPDAVIENRELLAADLLLIFDGPPHPSNHPTVKFGARGIVTVTLQTYGPRVPQHSGHYGNYAPNPAFHLARILASMKDEDGRVLIPGFYDGVELSDEVREILADDEVAIRAAMGISRSEGIGDNLQESVQYPSLNIRGLSSGWVGEESRTIVPATAVAEIDIRLVKESDPDYLVGLVRQHIAGLGYYVIDREPTEDERQRRRGIVTMTSNFSYSAYRSGFDEAAGVLARKGLRHLYGEEPILIRTSGGSIPISPFVETLGIPAASVPTVNIDNNQHSPNENIRLGNFIEGIAMLVAVLSQDID